MGGTLGCVPRQDCQGTSSLVYVETGPVTNGPNGPAAPDGDMEVLPRAPRHPSERYQIPGSGCNNCGPALVNLGHLLEKHTNQPCTAWLHPCCSQYMPNEIATTIEAPDAAPGPIPTQLPQEKTQDADGFELSEDISEELKLMGMEVWLAAALAHGDDEAKPMTLSPVEVSCNASRASARQPEEEPGASEQESTSEVPEAIMESPMIKETKQNQDAADQVTEERCAPTHEECHAEEAAVSPAVCADPVAESEELNVNDVDKDEAEGEGAYPELFHISALNLSPDVEEEETTVEAPLSARLRQVGTVAAPPPPLPSRGKDIKRRRSAEVMLW